MAKFKIILSNPETGKSQIIELEGSRTVPLVGRRLGEIIDGTAVGLGGHKVKITGGSDKDGFPMRPDIHGGVKTQVIITKGIGFHSSKKGERRRKTLRGSVITEEIVQINMKITEKPKKAKKEKQSKRDKTKDKAMRVRAKKTKVAVEKVEQQKKKQKSGKREPKEDEKKPKEP